MLLIYNGIQLPLLRIVKFDQKPVYSDDGTDVLYHHFRIGAECTFNPGVFNAAWHNQSRSVVTPLSPHIGTFSQDLVGQQPNLEMPAASIARMRLALLAPRRLLTIQDDRGAVIIESPIILAQGQFAGGYTNPAQIGPPQASPKRAKTDCCNGPKPITFDVLSWEASRTARCYYEIETWVKECPPLYRRTVVQGGYSNQRAGGYTNPNIVEGGASGNTITSPGQSAVISHRWEESHSIDDLGWTTRHIAGQIRFRKDVLLEMRLEPDDFRVRLFPRPPVGFVRTIDGVGTSPDGLTCYYKVTDTQEPRSLIGQFKQYRFRGNYTAGFDNPGGVLPIRFEQLHLEIWGQPTITGSDAIPGNVLPNGAGGIGAFIGNPVAATAQAVVAGAAQAAAGALVGPNLRMIMVNDLFALANQLVAFGGENIQQPAFGRFHGTQVWVDLYERHAVLDTKWTLGGVAGFLEEVGNATANIARAQAIVFQELVDAGEAPTVALTRAPTITAFRLSRGIPIAGLTPGTLTLLQKVEKALRNNNVMSDANVFYPANTPEESLPPARGPHARGTYAGIIVAQALKATCEVPPFGEARPEKRRTRIPNQGTGSIDNWQSFGVPNRPSGDAAIRRGSINNESGIN